MTPEQEDAARRALAAEPPAPPMPAEVAARLDETLAGLVAERRTIGAGSDAATPAAPGDDLAAARARRRRVPRLLVAAAGVAVLGIGVGTVFENLSGQGDDNATTAGVTADDGGAESAPEDRAEGGLEGDGEPSSTLRSRPDDGDVDRGALEGGLPGPLLALEPDATALRSERLADDVARVLAAPRARSAQNGDTLVPAPPSSDEEAGEAADLISRCALPATGPRDLLVAVRLDGVRGTLVVRGASDGARVAEVYACDDAERLLAETEVDPR